jgi:2-polyprenyl-3-methyl-5-hydroxy-6-metoxy-1,4-benzoquinol methylase
MLNPAQNILLFLNKFFKPPVHPFNLSNEGGSSYAEWQYEKGARTIELYMPNTSAEEMFSGKTVLDIGCGAAGKSLYYASLGARRVVGLDVLERYRGEALEHARRKGFEDRFEYVCADAAETGFADGEFDTVIMNDAVEHVARPEAVLC